MKTSPTTLESKNNSYLPELDLLRGLAAVFMVVNHMGFQLLNQAVLTTSNFTTYMLTLTCYAPVLFFFASGVGSGVQSIYKNSQFQLGSVFYKFGLLVTADLFFALGNGKFFGLDFLGFIGVSLLLLELVRCSRKPLIICISGIALIFIMRYLIAPKLHIEEAGIMSSLANWLFGSVAIDNVSYPFAPWFTYPLLGFIFGVAWAKKQSPLIYHVPVKILLTATALFFELAAFYLNKHGFSFFRWGTVGIGFYVLSFTVILSSILAITWLHNSCSESWLKFFYLRGTASLAIVPIHYVSIYILKNLLPSGINLLPFVFVILIALPLCFSIANCMNRIGKLAQAKAKANNKLTLTVLWSLIALSALLTYNFHTSARTISIIASTFGQLVICLLFSTKLKKT